MVVQLKQLEGNGWMDGWIDDRYRYEEIKRHTYTYLKHYELANISLNFYNSRYVKGKIINVKENIGK